MIKARSETLEKRKTAAIFGSGPGSKLGGGITA
jgi:hypothetical protein